MTQQPKTETRERIEKLYQVLNLWDFIDPSNTQDKTVSSRKDIDSLESLFNHLSNSQKEEWQKDVNERLQVGEDGWTKEYGDGWHDGYAMGKKDIKNIRNQLESKDA